MKNNPVTQSTANERRSFFRVNDQVLLRYQPVDESSALANRIPAAFKTDPGYCLMQELQAIDRNHAVFLRAIAEQNRDLEAYLKGQDKKLELIAAKIIEHEGTAPDQKKQRVSISEGGLSIQSDSPLANNGYLALQITLLPTHHTLMVFAKVINCSAVSAGGYNIALSFIHLKDSDRQQLAKHIMQLQLTQRRNKTSDD